ncbi:hypothetical protein PILCRDRAFT_792669 [Piloderma croceum F 1598]|uniref:Uncharacterized protein n=1 Tax=Piloderma croceum (strain F 1598) TaxID=765440 RepID=A0A0C3F1Z6_PILCF|nr:hypothetical protein PILCRDRAFT_792669 [Piloderma croceum F 1598]
MVATGLEPLALLFLVKTAAKVIPIPFVGTKTKIAAGREKLSISVERFAQAKEDMEQEDRARLQARYESLRIEQTELSKIKDSYKRFYLTNNWKAHKFALGVEKFYQDACMSSCSSQMTKDKKLRNMSAPESEAFAQMNAAKENGTVQSVAAASGCTAEDCDYVLITKDKVYFDGVRSSSRSDRPTVVIQRNNGQGIHFSFS